MKKYLITGLLIAVFCFEFAGYAKDSVKFKKGIDNLELISGKGAGDGLMKAFGSISPELGTLIVEYGFGDVYDREGLDFETKEIAILANMIAGGSPAAQLKSHINAALNLGCSVTEIKEVIIQLAAYAGFPKANNAIFLLKEILSVRADKGINDNLGAVGLRKESEVKSRYELGVEEYEKLGAGSVQELRNAFKNVSPDLPEYLLEFGYGDIQSRSGLSRRNREIVAISALTALGSVKSQLEFHIKGALNIGVTREEIAELMILLSMYSGMPSAMNGTTILAEVVSGKTDTTEEISVVWELTGFAKPESVFADDDHKWLYVSNYNGKEKGFISRLTKDGKVDNMKWIEDVDSPTGMDMYKNKLYVVDQNKVHIIDVDTAEIIESIVAADAKALNDITISASGEIFVSDIFGSKIFTLKDNKLLVWMDAADFPFPNGVLVDDDSLIIGNFGRTLKKDEVKDDYGSLYRINISDKSFKMIHSSYKAGRLDGVAHLGEGYIISNGVESELQYITDNERKSLGYYPGTIADIGTEMRKSRIYAPFLTGNKVVCYKVNMNK